MARVHLRVTTTSIDSVVHLSARTKMPLRGRSVKMTTRQPTVSPSPPFSKTMPRSRHGMLEVLKFVSESEQGEVG